MSRVPALFDRCINSAKPAVDEWTLCENLDAVSPTEKARVYEEHLSTFVTELDFIAMAAAGIKSAHVPPSLLINAAGCAYPSRSRPSRRTRASHVRRRDLLPR